VLAIKFVKLLHHVAFVDQTAFWYQLL